MNFGINMHELVIYLKATILLSVVWLTDKLMISFSSFNFLSPEIKELLIESKDLVNLLVSLCVLFVTILKIVKEKRGLKK